MSIKDTLTQQGMKLMGDPRLVKLMQDERFMKLVMAAMAVPGKVQNFSDEQKDAIAKNFGLVQDRDFRALKRKVADLEAEVALLKTKK